MRSAFYGGYAGDNPGDLSEARVESIIGKFGAKWPYDALFVQEGTDFQLVTMDTAKRIHAWNARWAYPRLLCATMDMFFDDIVRQMRPGQVKSFAGDGNNQWADQDANDAWALGHARRLAESIPTAEKFATIAQIVAGGGNSWTDLYQAYHRLLTWHEHTNAIDFIAPDLERMRRYETELEENREMIRESEEFAARVWASAQQRITARISRESQASLIVFNALARPRTDAVRVEAGVLVPGDRIVDPASGREIPWQVMPEGGSLFVAVGVPSLGYKTFAVRRGDERSTTLCVVNCDAERRTILGGEAMTEKEKPSEGGTPTGQTMGQSPAATLENRFFTLTFDPGTGTITSIWDKQRKAELVDQQAPHRFNEYLYERFETADWKAPTTWHRVRAATLKSSSGPVAQVMQVQAHPVGVERLTQTVVLYTDLPRIDFTLDLVKAPSGRRDKQPNSDPRGKESLYVALPLAIRNPQVKHELPGCVSEPVRDLFDGANTAFYAVQHFADLSNGRYGVSVSAADSSLVQYDRPRSTPIGPAGEDKFEKTKTPITTGRLYLYLMNNMFDVNVRWDQPGPAHFAYSVRSHDGDWRQGKADEFGWDAANPLLAIEVHGKCRGTLPGANSFVLIDQENVECTTVKPAEANGAGFILRFVETRGRQTTATVALPLLAPLASASLVNLVEDDRQCGTTLRVVNCDAARRSTIGDGTTSEKEKPPEGGTPTGGEMSQSPTCERLPGNRIALKLPPYGVKTIRVVCQAAAPASVPDLTARAASDMEIALSWGLPSATDGLSHYHVYRGTKPDFQPGLLNLVARPAGTSCVDRPQLHYGGWINNRLEPDTAYYYRVAAVDRWNHEGPASRAVAATTMKSSEKHMPPLEVERLSAVLVSPLSRFNAVNLLWRTNCESDVQTYEVHRSTIAGFEPTNATRIAVVDTRTVLKGGGEYGQTPIAYRLGDFDHQMYLDTAVEPSTTYHYRVCAVDTAGQKGRFSRGPGDHEGHGPPDLACQGDLGPIRLRASVRRGTGDRRLGRPLLCLDLQALWRRHEREAARRLVGDGVSQGQEALACGREDPRRPP